MKISFNQKMIEARVIVDDHNNYDWWTEEHEDGDRTYFTIMSWLLDCNNAGQVEYKNICLCRWR